LKVLVLAGFIVVGGCFLLSGCSTAPKTLKSDISGPQVIVNPDTLRLGVARVTGTNLVFDGSGYQPEDTVVIVLLGPEETEIAIAEGQVRDDGTFRTAVGPLGKIDGILRARISGAYTKDGKYNQFILITQPPIPTGVYTVKATGMISDQEAETTMNIKKPSLGDRAKDWLGTKLGKIKHGRT